MLHGHAAIDEPRHLVQDERLRQDRKLVGDDDHAWPVRIRGNHGAGLGGPGCSGQTGDHRVFGKILRQGVRAEQFRKKRIQVPVEALAGFAGHGRPAQPQADHLGQGRVPAAQGLDAYVLEPRFGQQSLQGIGRIAVVVVGRIMDGPQKRGGEEKEAAGGEHAADFRKYRQRFGTVFEHFRGHGAVHGAIGQGDGAAVPGQVRLHAFGVLARGEIEADIPFDAWVLGKNMVPIGHLAAPDVKQGAGKRGYGLVEPFENGLAHKIPIGKFGRKLWREEGRIAGRDAWRQGLAAEFLEQFAGKGIVRKVTQLFLERFQGGRRVVAAQEIPGADEFQVLEAHLAVFERSGEPEGVFVAADQGLRHRLGEQLLVGQDVVDVDGRPTACRALAKLPSEQGGDVLRRLFIVLAKLLSGPVDPGGRLIGLHEEKRKLIFKVRE